MSSWRSSVDPVDVEGAHADPVRGEPEANAAARQLVLREERVERLRERSDVAHLAADDDAALERPARHLDELRRAVVDDVRGGELRGADLEADELLLACARLGFGFGAATLAPLGFRFRLGTRSDSLISFFRSIGYASAARTRPLLEGLKEVKSV